jgi:hypothetical protein
LKNLPDVAKLNEARDKYVEELNEVTDAYLKASEAARTKLEAIVKEYDDACARLWDQYDAEIRRLHVEANPYHNP